jgi:nitroreductase
MRECAWRRRSRKPCCSGTRPPGPIRYQILAVARFATAIADDVPDDERLVSAGCAIQNMLLVATAQGFGSALTSGRALHAAALRDLFALRPNERALCFINIGTPSSRKPRRIRPLPASYVTTLGGET